MDVLYPVRHQENHEELRWSLRSLQNLPHNKVFLGGDIPAWTQMVMQCPKPKITDGRKDVFENLLLMLNDERCGEEITVFNDDMYVIKPIKEVGSYRGKTVGLSVWAAVSRPTMAVMKKMGCWSAYSTEHHIPFRCQKSKLLEVLNMIREYSPDEYGNVYWRTVYSNYFRVTGEVALDVKVRRNPVIGPDQVFISSEDTTFEKHLKQLLKPLFPAKSIYEK